MIVICDKAQDIVIPAGLGDNAGVVYEKSGVESLNGQQGDLTLKTVNGNELLGEGNIEITAGVESVNGETGAVKIKSVNGQSLMGDGDVPVDVGVETLNGQKGALTLKTVNGNELTGEGNIEIKAGVSSVNGKTGDVTVYDLNDYKICMFMAFNLTLSEADKGIVVYNYGIGEDGSNFDAYFGGFKTIQCLNFNIKDGASYKVPLTVFWDGNGNRQFRFVCEGYEYTYTSTGGNGFDFTSKVKVGGESGGGSDSVIVLDDLTQEEVKAIYDKLDKTKEPDAVFVYLSSYSFRTYWDGEGNLNFDIFRASYDAIELSKITVTKTGEIYRGREVQSYTNSCVIKVNSHINETDPFECEYIGSFLNYFQRVYNKPYAYFILFKQGYGASTKTLYVPFSVIWDKDPDTEPEQGAINIQFTIDGITYKYRNDLTNENSWQYDGKISMYDSHSINGFNGTSLVLGGVALDETDKNKYVAMRAMMGYDTIFNGDNDGSCPYLTITTTDSQMYKVPVVVKCNKQNDSATRATFEFDLNGYHYLYTQDNQGDFTFSFTSKTQIANINSDEVSSIKVLTQSEYDTLEPKDPNTLYCIKG